MCKELDKALRLCVDSRIVSIRRAFFALLLLCAIMTYFVLSAPAQVRVSRYEAAQLVKYFKALAKEYPSTAELRPDLHRDRSRSVQEAVKGCFDKDTVIRISWPNYMAVVVPTGLPKDRTTMTMDNLQTMAINQQFETWLLKDLKIDAKGCNKLRYSRGDTLDYIQITGLELETHPEPDGPAPERAFLHVRKELTGRSHGDPYPYPMPQRIPVSTNYERASVGYGHDISATFSEVYSLWSSLRNFNPNDEQVNTIIEEKLDNLKSRGAKSVSFFGLPLDPLLIGFFGPFIITLLLVYMFVLIKDSGRIIERNAIKFGEVRDLSSPFIAVMEGFLPRFMGFAVLVVGPLVLPAAILYTHVTTSWTSLLLALGEGVLGLYCYTSLQRLLQNSASIDIQQPDCTDEEE